jgi:hypothetical protein
MLLRSSYYFISCSLLVKSSVGAFSLVSSCDELKEREGGLITWS